MSSSVLRISNLTHDFGSLRALDGVTFEAPPGAVGLVGANGAGKTTLIKLCLGLLTPVSGTIEVLGGPPGGQPRVGYMPEASALPLDQKAADFVAYSAELAGLPVRSAKRRASETLYLVGLDEERFRYIGDFSTGMQQRVKLAQAIVHDPQLVFLDEPTAGLDPEGRDAMLELIKRLGGFGTNVVFSTHIITDIERTCDWALLLDGGSVLQSGAIEALGTTGLVRVEVDGHTEEVAHRLREEGFEAVVDAGVVLVRAGGAEIYEAIQRAVVAEQVGLRLLDEAQATLEELFFTLPPTEAPLPPPLPGQPQ